MFFLYENLCIFDRKSLYFTLNTLRVPEVVNVVHEFVHEKQALIGMWMLANDI